MTTSILNECLLLRDKPLKELADYLHSINITLFDEIIDNKKNKFHEDTPMSDLDDIEAKQTILYILCAFSEDSPMIIIRQDDKIEKEQICDFLQIPELYRPSLTNLSDPTIRRTVTSYVSQFAGPLFRNLVFLKIQLNDFQLNLTNYNYGTFEVNKDDENKRTYFYDIKEHGKANIETIRLSKAIDQLEKEIKSQVKRMEGIESMKEFKNKAIKKGGGARSGNVEGSVYIK